jgi:hypothetical protein
MTINQNTRHTTQQPPTNAYATNKTQTTYSEGGVGITMGYGLDDPDSIPDSARLFSSPQRPDRIPDLLSHLPNGYRGLLPRV